MVGVSENPISASKGRYKMNRQAIERERKDFFEVFDSILLNKSKAATLYKLLTNASLTHIMSELKSLPFDGGFYKPSDVFESIHKYARYSVDDALIEFFNPTGLTVE